MRSRPIPRGTLVVVKWVDITSADGWLPSEEVERYMPLDAASTGWVVNDDKDVLRLTSTICTADGTSNVMVIPKAVIKKIIRVPYERA